MLPNAAKFLLLVITRLQHVSLPGDKAQAERTAALEWNEKKLHFRELRFPIRSMSAKEWASISGQTNRVQLLYVITALFLLSKGAIWVTPLMRNAVRLPAGCHWDSGTSSGVQSLCLISLPEHAFWPGAIHEKRSKPNSSSHQASGQEPIKPQLKFSNPWISDALLGIKGRRRLLYTHAVSNDRTCRLRCQDTAAASVSIQKHYFTHECTQLHGYRNLRHKQVFM